ncbi:MAG: EamA family transporter [Phycisphaerae bacterium]|jgi:multidrug transporter EmrE-like cation transporter
MMKHWIALLAALSLNAAANLMMKFGINRHRSDLAGLVQPGWAAHGRALAGNWVLILGLFCFAANVVLYIFALKEIKISVAYPIMVSCGFAIIALVAWRFLHETLGPSQWLGVMLILVGVVLVARERAVAG